MRWTPDGFSETRQDAFFHGFSECRIPRRPAEAAHLCIAHAFVAFPAFAFLRLFPDRRQRAIQPLRQPAVAFALQNRLIIDHVVNLSGLCFSA